MRTAGASATRWPRSPQADVHVAIVDLMLPDGDGLALTRELKQRDPAIEVIVITAYGSVRKAMEATKGAGAFHVLEKPFDPDELLGLLEQRARAPASSSPRTRTSGAGSASRRPTRRSSAARRRCSACSRRSPSVADADANVLIVGESGTGKELIANALHERSRAPRRARGSRSTARRCPRT